MSDARFFGTLGAACCGLMLAAGAARAESNLLLVFDASNSMWGQIDGTAKIETAKSVLDELVGGLPEQVNPGLMVYGHRREGDCGDVELMVPVAPAAGPAVRAAVQGLTPRGKTPIAASLEQAWQAFAGREEKSNAIVLISDGIETCGGDPCAASAALAERGAGLRIHTVGFDVDADTRRQLECIAEAGRGRYFNADNAAELEAALQQAKAEVVADPEPEAEPDPEPEPTLYFEDAFDDGALGEEWTVEAPDPDGFIEEDGALILVDTAHGPAEAESARNVVRLSEVELPDGDFVATAEVEFGLQTARELFQFGVYHGPDNFVLAELYTSGDRNSGWGIGVRVRKVSGDQSAKFEQTLDGLGCNVCGEDRMFDDFAISVSQPITLELVKRGRSLVARARTADPDAEWVETDAVTTLRLRGDLVLHVGEYEDTAGEAFAAVDRVAIEITE